MTSAAQDLALTAAPAVRTDATSASSVPRPVRSHDRIVLTGLRARGHHGVLAVEREQGQDFVVDVVLHLDLAPASRSDDLSRTVHYGLLAEAVVADVRGEPLDLIEALAERIAQTCLRHAAVDEVEVTVHKPEAPITVTFSDVAVTLTRSRA